MQLREERRTLPQQSPPDPEAALAELAPGTVVNGFRLVRHVDTGSYGRVWLAVSIHNPGRYFALKFALASPGEDATADARAVREVQLLLQAAHPHVVRVLGYGRWPDPETGIHYTVLEWARNANPSLRTLVRLAQKVTHALQAAHERGVVHRDIKPDNLLVRGANGEPFLADFGVGETAGSPTLTRGGLPPGTQEFLSPEALAFSLRAGAMPYHFQPADDWYAVGVTLYELLAEVRPFPEGREGAEHARNVAQLRPVPPHVLNPQVPLALSRVVMRLLARKPSRRYRDGHALWAALDKVLAQEGAWDAPVYATDSPPEPGLTPSRYLTPRDESFAGDEEQAWTDALEHDDPPEDYRKAHALSRRDALLAVQSRPWPRALRRGVAALALLLAAAGVWAAWALVTAALLPAAAVPPPASRPPEALAPQSLTQAPPPPAVAPPAPGAVADRPPQPSVAVMTATSQKEDSAVKTPQSPPPSQPVSASRTKRPPKASRLGPVCAAGVLAAGCPGIPVRPPPKECPPAAINSMEALGIRPGIHYVGVKIDANGPPPAEFPNHTFRAGPIVSLVIDATIAPDAFMGALLFGKVIPGGGGHFFIRYEEAQLVGSTERVPVCAIVDDPDGPGAGMPKKEGSTDTAWNSFNGAPATFVFSFSE